MPLSCSQSKEYMMQQPTIFGRDGMKKVTKYQQQVNKAAVELALETPSLLSSQQKLLEVARKRWTVMDIYTKKERADPNSYVKQRNVHKSKWRHQTFWLKRISALEENIKDFNDRLSFKIIRKHQASNSRNYKLCDVLTEEMSAIKQQKRECEAELHQLKR